MYFGADYYPEHWPKERWAVDAKLMKEAGFNLIRVAEFAWAKLEPAEGHWDFGWLDEALDVFYKEGIQVVMGTPTATPPKWLMDKHPEIYQVDENGVVQGFGSRRHYCYNSEIYREYSEKIVEKMARHYAGHPAVAAWQIDNEFTAGDGLYCYCEECRQKFIVWLKKKYGSLDALNEAWGTVFWSQTYTDWDQIIVPRRSAAHRKTGDREYNAHNPGLNLDYSRLQSDAIVDYSNAQARILRRWNKMPITHNMVHEELDYYKFAEQIDICTFDNYPAVSMHLENRDPVVQTYNPALQADIVRGAKNKNIWIMEEQSGPCGWNVLGSTPRPGQIREWSYQMMAHGAESIIYFRWRACLFGTEEYWYGILDHDGVPRRRYEEIKAIGREMPKLAAYNENSRVDADILMIRSFEQQWSHAFQQHSWNFDYRTYLFELYRGLEKGHYNLDVSNEAAEFSNYKLVVAPAFNLMDEALKDKFEKYVAEGGNLVITFRSGTKNMDNSMTERTLPGYFKELAGAEVEEFDSRFRSSVGVKGDFGCGKASIWADILRPETAETVAVYTGDYFEGRPAITMNRYGKGKCYYVGCDLDRDGTDALMEYIARQCGIAKAMAGLPNTVEVVRKKTSEGKTFYFLINPQSEAQNLQLPFVARDLLTHKTLGSSFEISAYGAMAIEAEN